MKNLLPPFLVCIGSSTGGPSALKDVLSQIPKGYQGAVIVVQHLGDNFTEALADWLQDCTELVCKVPENDQLIEAGTLYLAPGGKHLVIKSGGRLGFEPALPSDIHTPSVDRLFESAAQHSTGVGVGVLLSGMGRDGAKGLVALKRSGFVALTQSESSCVVYGMPRAAVLLDASDFAFDPVQIGAYLSRFASETKVSRGINGPRRFDRKLLLSLAANASGKAGAKG